MANIVCKQCGYENPEGSTICEICAEPLNILLNETINNSAQEIYQEEHENTLFQKDGVIDKENEFYVICPESQTKTILQNGNISSFYCEGCRKKHDVDGFLWNIEKKPKVKSNVTVSNGTNKEKKESGNHLYLEEVNSHFRIDIDDDGGTLGRYGKYGSGFFQSGGLLMVSGEHCLITNEFGNWVLRHKSKTNQTIYNNMILEMDTPNLLESGKVITLANTVSFIVRIE